MLAIALFGVADVATTTYFIATTPAVEGNPIVAAAIEAVGLWALIPWKVAGFAAIYALYRLAPRVVPYVREERQLWRLGVPIGIGALGGVVVAWNLFLGLGGSVPF